MNLTTTSDATYASPCYGLLIHPREIPWISVFERLKLALIEFLKTQPKTQVESIMNGIEQKIGRRPTKDEEKVILELIHEFSTSNIIMPAMDRYNSGWPWFGLTEHGSNVIHNAGPPVYDYNGYLA